MARTFTIVSHHRSLQWLHSFKDPDGKTTRWFEKLASSDYTVRHRPGTSVVHSDGLSRVPSHEVNVIVHICCQTDYVNQNKANVWGCFTTTRKNEDDHAYNSSEELSNREIPPNLPAPEFQSEQFCYQGIIGDLSYSTDSLVLCVSADFKITTGTARTIRRNFSTSYPNIQDNRLNPLWPQWIPEQKRYIYHLVT